MPNELFTVNLPEMGESVTEGTITVWSKSVGERVEAGETLVSVSTDKVDVEVPAPEAGVLTERLAEEGDTLPVGAPLARLDPNGEPSVHTNGANGSENRSAPSIPASAAGAAAGPPTGAASVPTTGNSPASAPPPAKPIEVGAEEIEASARARHLAHLRGVPLTAIPGSGPGGAVRAMDVLRAGAGPGATVAASLPTLPPMPTGRTAIKGAAAALAGHMEKSLTIPTATSFRTIPVETLDARRRQLNNALKAAGQPIKVSFTHLLGWAIVRSAAEWAVMNVSFDRTEEGAFRSEPGAVNLGLAVDIERRDGSRGLMVPVLKAADRMDFRAFRNLYEELVTKTRDNRLAPDDLSGASITLTNPGGIGTSASVPRLLSGQGTIVAAGSIGYPPGLGAVAEERLRELGVQKVMTLTSTYDHRVIQGAESGNFLRRIEELLHGADGFYESVFAALGLDTETVIPPADHPAIAAATPGGTETPQRPLASGGTRVDEDLIYAATAGMALVKAYRTHGHLASRLDPLGVEPSGDPALEPATVGLTPELMARVPAHLLRTYVRGANLAEVLVELRETYCGTIAYEIEHISSHEQRVWLRREIESGKHRRPLPRERQTLLLRRLQKVNALEVFLRRTYLGQKTFSLEGLDMLSPMLEYSLELLGEQGTREVVLGMAHRGRLNVIAHVVNQPYEGLLMEFEGAHSRQLVDGEIDLLGDVKYHAAAEGTYVDPGGRPISVTLMANPSHLEAVNPVVEGSTRARQTVRRGHEPARDPQNVVPILIHGDAAFAGQGVVAETLNLHDLTGYSTGGTLHLIGDNQVGFTTEPREGRSTRYASDLAKGFDIPIIHVNADDPEACLSAVSLALAYRTQFGQDFVIDLIGYRRFGHNETDEPAYTQPHMYERIKDHPPVADLYARYLTGQGVASEEQVESWSQEAWERLQTVHADLKRKLASAPSPVQESLRMEKPSQATLATGVAEGTLRSLNEELLAAPTGFTIHPKLARQLDRRREALDTGQILFPHAEALAFASLLTEGVPLRLTGQDTERGTFSQRHLVWHDPVTGQRHAPIQNLAGARVPLELHNSPLSEYACVGFEYGYSVAAPETLVLWEAQYGDFFNGAQIIVDQFIAAGLAKWGQPSRLTLLLPHGYEGSGPEHSSARIERWLQLGAEGNLRVANPSNAAQYFHLLRRQALFSEKRPLIIFTPKSTLRLPAAAATLQELSQGSFSAVIPDARFEGREHEARRVVLVSGKLYWELDAHPSRAAGDVALVRIELLYPFPANQVGEILARYSGATDIVWAQEEPKNMGAWKWASSRIADVMPRGLHLGYAGRPRRASPSEGYPADHEREQSRIIEEALSGQKP